MWLAPTHFNALGFAKALVLVHGKPSRTKAFLIGPAAAALHHAVVSRPRAKQEGALCGPWSFGAMQASETLPS